MIDTHCHLIPGVDDGPAEQTEALELARVLIADGVSEVICTPHYSRFFTYPHEVAADRLASLEEALGLAGLPLALTLAAEVHPALAVSAPVEELRRRSIADRFVVVEVLPDSPGPLFAAAIDRLAETGMTPVFAHPERSRVVQRHPALLDAVRRDGGLVQVVAPSLLGRWGDDVREAAWRLVDTGRADLVGSDAHGARRRRAHLREAADLIEARLGHAVATALTLETPRAVLDGSFERPDPGTY